MDWQRSWFAYYRYQMASVSWTQNFGYIKCMRCLQKLRATATFNYCTRRDPKLKQRKIQERKANRKRRLNLLTSSAFFLNDLRLQSPFYLLIGTNLLSDHLYACQFYSEPSFFFLRFVRCSFILTSSSLCVLNALLATPVHLTTDITSSIPLLQSSNFPYTLKSTVVLIDSDKRNSKRSRKRFFLFSWVGVWIMICFQTIGTVVPSFSWTSSVPSENA